MLTSAFARPLAMQRWFKISNLELNKHFKVGNIYTDNRKVTHAMVNNRTQLGHFLISTPSLASSLHVFACSVVDDTLPSNYHAMTRHSQIRHREPLLVGDNMKMAIRVNKIDGDQIDFDMKVLKLPEEHIVADGLLKMKVIQTESF
jgi:predicted thioesterase